MYYVRIDIINYFCFEMIYVLVKLYLNLLGIYILLFLVNVCCLSI